MESHSENFILILNNYSDKKKKTKITATSHLQSYNTLSLEEIVTGGLARRRSSLLIGCDFRCAKIY